MRPRFLFLTMALVIVLTVVSCSAPVAPTVDSPPSAFVAAETLSPQPTAALPQAAEVQAVPTSRGPKLQATDPSTVRLAAGQLQLLEFFRFT